MSDGSLSQLLIVGIDPYFLDKEFLWFEENLKNILTARHTQNFFEDNIIFLEKDHSFQFSQFLRKLDEMGYERVFKVSDPGEFSQRGGIIDVFPINITHAVRLDFLGNEVQVGDYIYESFEQGGLIEKNNWGLNNLIYWWK